MRIDWRKYARAGYRFSTEKLPTGVRSVAGVLLVGLGLLGFLPILGFWMIPAGLLMIALDVPALRRRIGRRLGVS